MDLKVICLLFGCLLIIALAQGEEADGEGGSQEKGPSEECNCDRRRGGHGRRDGEKKCFPMFGLFKECKDFNKMFCDNFDKEEMKRCWKMDTSDGKHECMASTVQVARDSFEGSFPECLNAVSKFINPKQ